MVLPGKKKSFLVSLLLRQVLNAASIVPTHTESFLNSAILRQSASRDEQGIKCSATERLEIEQLGAMFPLGETGQFSCTLCHPVEFCPCELLNC